MVWASITESLSPKTSKPNCQNWRYLPACGLSCRKQGPKYQSRTGWGNDCIPFSIYALAIGAVHSGLNAKESPPFVLKEYISLLTISVDAPMLFAKSSEFSRTGVLIFPKS